MPKEPWVAQSIGHLGAWKHHFRIFFFEMNDLSWILAWTSKAKLGAMSFGDSLQGNTVNHAATAYLIVQESAKLSSRCM